MACKSALIKTTWQPQWVLENRLPSFIGGDGSLDSSQVKFGAKKFLWGNLPAIDILQLSSNEGEAYSQDLNILFAGESS